ncbi:MAG: M14 family zinc carboxypeptidase, partial [Pseudonocardiaceae bacterium]
MSARPADFDDEGELMGRIWKPSRAIRAALAATATAAALTAGTLAGPAAATEPVFPVQLVTVDTPSRDHKRLLQSLGLDLTEHAGHDFVEVVLHSAGDADALRAAGLTWQVRIPDLVARSAEINRANRAYAAATPASPLPSGRNTYRTLADYNDDMRELAAIRPDIVKRIELPHTSLEGKPVYGVEIGSDVHAPPQGRPVFVMLGLHHAREWPSGEMTMEFAYDLVQNYGRDSRITGLLDKSRVVIVPVVNVDGFEKSVNDGMLIDLREVDDGGTASVVATPGNAYKRKNCRMVDGQTPVAGECALATSNGGFGFGIDLNRNYGALWGGPGSAGEFPDPTYRGAGPFSEPETQNVRELVGARQVTTLITNHTFSNLVLRPNGVAPDTIGPDGHPVGNAPDETALKALGDEMAKQNGYTSQHGWELYDTTGTTEDWSYNATGGFGYTFEIGESEFHPPFEEVVRHYFDGSDAPDNPNPHAHQGNREAYLIALENAVDTTTHSVIAGKAPAGATLRLRKEFSTPTWESSFTDRLNSTMVVGPNGKFTWHVNPSTRPIVAAKQAKVISGDPLKQETTTGTTLPTMSTDTEFVVDQEADALEVTLDWPTPDDLDLYVFREEADGTLTEVGSSASFVGVK